MNDKRDQPEQIKHRRTRPIPAGLKKILDWFGVLTSDLQPTREIKDELSERYSPSEVDQEFLKEMKRVVGQLPRKIQCYIGPLQEGNSSRLNGRAFWRYNDLVYSFRFLTDIALISHMVISELRKNSQALNEENAKKVIASLDKEFLPYAPQIAFYKLPITEEGKFDWTLHPLLGALQNEDITRIRICAICGHIFWAGRLDKTTCSKKCGQVHRKHKQRAYLKELPDEKKNQYNAERRKKRKKRREAKPRINDPQTITMKGED